MKQFYSLEKDNEYKSCKMFFMKGDFKHFWNNLNVKGFVKKNIKCGLKFDGKQFEMKKGCDGRCIKYVGEAPFYLYDVSFLSTQSF